MDWSRLVDPSVQNYDDPYRELTPEQLTSLVTVARLRERAANGEPIDEERLSRESASLSAARIDVDRLIAQRWIVAERRERAATSGNKEVDGREVVLSGFVIPAPADDDGKATGYLVAERGMCSHMPPPSPNQMVRLRLPENWRPQAIYQPVRVSGLLSIEPTARTVRVVDGLVPMHATFTMNVSSVETPASLRGAEASQHVASEASHSHGNAEDKHEH
ncbi:MAG: DUF3299 domain-containing protein [Betaproteobacteria bacterium]|nr:MAG: DUF3299 domain-containing protein [Betaproteobacteria bacterium]